MRNRVDGTSLKSLEKQNIEVLVDKEKGEEPKAIWLHVCEEPFNIQTPS